MGSPLTSTPGLRRIALTAAALAIAPQAFAADWRFDPTIEVGVMTDSNLRLDEGDERVDVAGGFAAAQLRFNASTPLADLSFTPRIEMTHFPSGEDSDEDYVDRGVNALWIRRWRTGLSRFQADYDDSSTVSGNRADVRPDDDGGLGNPDEPGDSGSLSASNRMRSINLRETLQFDLNERDRFELAGSLFDREFDDQLINEDVSFTALGGHAGWSRQVHERAQLGLRARVLRFDPELIPVITTHFGVEGEWRYRVSERFDSYVRAGASRANYKASGGADPGSRTSFVGGIGGSWQMVVSRVLLDLTRTVDPNSSGVTVSRSQARLRLDRDFSERARGSLAVRLISDDGAPGFNERRYAVASVGSEWRFTRAWSLAGRYDYSWQDYELTSGSASSNAFRLSLTFRPQRDAGNSGSLLD